MRFAIDTRRFGVVAAIAGASAFLAVPVWASPNTTQYSNPSTTTPTVVTPAQVGGVQAKVAKPAKKPAASAPVSTTRKASPGSLPFTGMDLTVVAILGTLLVLTGIVVRRVARPANDK
jgi:hypothetical protein